MSVAGPLATARTFLFVPGNRPERFDKAIAAGADLVILDLEDSVGLDAKKDARAAAAGWLDECHPVAIRVNSLGSPWFEDDLALCRHPGVAAVVLPRAEPGVSLERIAEEHDVLALIETATGVEGLEAVARTRGVTRLGIGLIDLSLDLGITMHRMLDPVLLRLVIASRAAGCSPPVAEVTPDFRHLALVEKDAARARAMGFTGKLCIHPAQLAAVLQGLSPTAAEVAHARRVVAVALASGGSAIGLEGRMIDRPVIEQAQRILSAASRPGRDRPE